MVCTDDRLSTEKEISSRSSFSAPVFLEICDAFMGQNRKKERCRVQHFFGFLPFHNAQSMFHSSCFFFFPWLALFDAFTNTHSSIQHHLSLPRLSLSLAVVFYHTSLSFSSHSFLSCCLPSVPLLICIFLRLCYSTHSHLSGSSPPFQIPVFHPSSFCSAVNKGTFPFIFKALCQSYIPLFILSLGLDTGQ